MRKTTRTGLTRGLELTLGWGMLLVPPFALLAYHNGLREALIYAACAFGAVVGLIYLFAAMMMIIGFEDD